MGKTKKRLVTGLIIGIPILLLFLLLSPASAASQPGFLFFLAALEALVTSLWVLAPTLAPACKTMGGELLRLLKHPFFRFVVKKAVFYLVVIFITLNLIFIIPRLMQIMYGVNPVDKLIPPGIVDEARRRVRQELLQYYGLDKPIQEQYIDFWGKLLSGDLGVTYEVPSRSVAAVLMDALPFTLALVIPVLLIGFYVGNWIGARAAYVQNKRSEALYFTSVFAAQMPYYWFAMVLLFLGAVWLRVFPLAGTYGGEILPGISPFHIFLVDVSRHYALPFLTLLIITTGGWATGMRSMTLYELDSGYILYSRQLGFRKGKLMSYAQRNAILPQFTGLNINLNNLIGMTLITEIVFNWRGVGWLQLQAIQRWDYTLMLGCFLIAVIVVVIGNFLVDIAYGFLDPRIRTGRG
jgi:peptide/nickel transport system permease protein